MGAIRRRRSLGLQAALRHDLTLGGAMALVVLFRVCDAVHLDAGDCAAGDEQLEMAGAAVCLYERAGVCGGAGDEPGDYALLLKQ